LRREFQVQRSQIQLFSAKIEELEKKLSRLKDIDRRVRTIANLERGYEITPFIGMGGPPHKKPQSSDVNPSPH
jgi:prefoldin subunit 5